MSAILDLQGLIQSIATQRRTGELSVSTAGEVRRLRFGQGAITGITGHGAEVLIRSFQWAGVATREALVPVVRGIPAELGLQGLVQALLTAKAVTPEAVLDALDCLLEEEMTALLGWTSPEVGFTDRVGSDPWADFQARLGMSVAPGGLLLEALRRQDEMASVAELIPHPWDSLLREVSNETPVGADAGSMLDGWRDGIVAGALLENPRLPPFRATMALAELRRSGRIRLSTPEELVAQAEAAVSSGMKRKGLGLYRRAVALGQDTPRIQLHIADLAEGLGDRDIAAQACLAAAVHQSDQAQAAATLHRAIALGAQADVPLRQLVNLYTALGETEAAAGAIMDLAAWYEGRSQWEQAITCLREAQELNADPAITGQGLARLYTALGDHDQAALQTELAARAFHETDRLDEATACWRDLMSRLPGRVDFAKECAELLLWSGRREEAVQVLRPALTRQVDASEDLLVSAYELLSKLDPSDVQSHEFLAKAFERRRDRRGATEQLRLSANALEKSGDDLALSVTLEKILALDPDQVDEVMWLAKVRLRLHQDGLAATLFLKAFDLAIAQGQRREARSLIEGALVKLPWVHQLHSRLALAALKDGDRSAALKYALSAADLASGCGDMSAARDMLQHAGRLRPDDLLLKVRLADAAALCADPDLDRIEAEVIRAAVRSSNHGIALEHARRRIERNPTYEIRSELMELLRRAGDHTGELAIGQELLADVLAEGGFDRAVEILSRLVASHPKNADLALQLAEANNSLGDQRTALRLYRHALVLLQADERVQDAKDVLEIIAEQSDEPEVVALVRERLAQGLSVDWERVRLELAQRRRLLERVATDAVVRRSTTERRRLPSPRTPLPDAAP